MRQKISSVFVDFTTTQTGRQVFSLSASIYCSLLPCITCYPSFRHRLFCDRLFISCRSFGQTQLSQALAEHSSCALVPMNLSRVVVDPVLCCGDFFRCHLREIRAFRVPAAAFQELFPASVPCGARDEKRLPFTGSLFVAQAQSSNRTASLSPTGSVTAAGTSSSANSL